MKFIQTADVHLGLMPDAGKPWSMQRGKSIWKSFEYVTEQVGIRKADLLLIAGDLFHRQPLKRELKEVSAMFERIRPAQVVLIAGNHDCLRPKSYYLNFKWPDNVHMITDDHVTGVNLKQLNTTVWGCSFWKPDDPEHVYSNIRPSGPGYHILLGHGGDDRHHPFQVREILDAGFDYAAFGHIHKGGSLAENRVVMSGALEPTDCNDFGPHGFWSGELTKQGCRVQFHPLSCCEYVVREVETNPEMGQMQILRKTEQILMQRQPYEISHVIFSGKRDADIEIPVEEVLQMERVVRAVDRTEPDYSYEKLKDEYKGTLIEAFIREMEKMPQTQSREDALYFGVQAMLNAMEQ